MGRVNRLPILRRLVSLAVALFAAPALAAAAQAPDVAAWLVRNTDLPLAQVVISGPDVVYGFEALTPRLPTGEVIGQVRTEAISPAWAEVHHFRSWDAHILFDCDGGRMRFIRSATYSGANRQGKPTLRAESGEWISPRADEPGAKLVAAACDPGFPWPLRAAPAAAAPQAAPTSTVIAAALPAPRASALAAATPVPTAHGEYAVQVAYGPHRTGAFRALAKARRLLGATPDRLAATMLRSHAGDARRYTAVLDGFSSAEAATQACATLAKAGQPCFTRRSPTLLQATQAVQAPGAAVERAKANVSRPPRKGLRMAEAAHLRRARLAFAGPRLARGPPGVHAAA